jgi:Protein of unknown function (DUF1279)
VRNAHRYDASLTKRVILRFGSASSCLRFPSQFFSLWRNDEIGCDLLKEKSTTCTRPFSLFSTLAPLSFENFRCLSTACGSAPKFAIRSSSSPVGKTELGNDPSGLSTSTVGSENGERSLSTALPSTPVRTTEDGKSSSNDQGGPQSNSVGAEKARFKTTAKFREQLENYRDNARERYHELSDRAKEGVEAFREHPRESAVESAKGIGMLFRQYGPVFVVTYGGLYFLVLGSLYAGVEAGVLDPVSLLHQIGVAGATSSADAEASRTTLDFVVNFMETHEVTQPYAETIRDDYPWLANFMVAWIATKFTEPLRLPLAAAFTPRIAKTFGWGKPQSDSTAASANAAKVATTPPEDANSPKTPH